jgi:hypothetical protein
LKLRLGYSFAKRLLRMLQPERVDETIGKHSSASGADEVKADEYRYWQSRPVHERMAAVAELSLAMYGIKGTVQDPPKMERTLVCFEHLPKSEG